MAKLDVNPEQVNPQGKATQRRALGRFFMQRASQLSIMQEGLFDRRELAHMDDAERKKFDKIAKNLKILGLHLGQLGADLEDNHG